MRKRSYKEGQDIRVMHKDFWKDDHLGYRKLQPRFKECDFDNFLVQTRMRLNVTQKMMADLLGFKTHTTVYLYEKGAREIPRVVYLACLALLREMDMADKINRNFIKGINWKEHRYKQRYLKYMVHLKSQEKIKAMENKDGNNEI